MAEFRGLEGFIFGVYCAVVSPKNIKIVPTNELNHNFKVDYEDMAKSMIVGIPPTHEELLKNLYKMQIQLRREDF